MLVIAAVPVHCPDVIQAVELELVAPVEEPPLVFQPLAVEELV
jgi:hypothetical protein